jgi:tetratricopeptide (TPR) repeat protein/NAD-dependent dihydropyrimidine dehydrogenase PreA subunit
MAKVLSHPSRFGRWRFLTLLLVHILMVIHVLHWKISGKTLAPLELNEVMHTIELGIVTAGFVFMMIAIVATAVFGRFFCSWGCHILALQDMCSWLLAKVRITPKAVRSRILLWVPLIAAAYMFLWPQIVRIAEGRPFAQLRVATDADGWASFTTENYWRNLPGPGIAILTFAICGFVIVYVLGSRSFCTYGCPYGAVFRLVDRFAPGRIRVGQDCTQCGTCTAVCDSHVRVHEELARFGTVVDPACMKDLDCVSACPQQSLHFGMGRPALITPTISGQVIRRQFDFVLWEECVLAVVFVACLVIYRGLYNRVPFLMTLAVSAVLAYFSIVLLRLISKPTVKFNRWVLKDKGQLRLSGRAFGIVAAAALALTVHSGFIQYHAVQGRRYFHMTPITPQHQDRAIDSLEQVAKWGLIGSTRNDAMLGSMLFARERTTEAVAPLVRVVREEPTAQACAQLATIRSKQNRPQDARRLFTAALQIDPGNAEAHYLFAGFHFDGRSPSEAIQHLETAIRLQPEFPEAHYDLGALLLEQGDVGGGIEHLKRAVDIRNTFADAHYNLAVALAMSGDLEGAGREIKTARQQDPNDPQKIAFEEHLNRVRGR